jgi:maleate isomerase
VEAKRSVGVVWPGPLSPGDFDELQEFVPPGVGLDVAGTGSEPDPDRGITLEHVLTLPGDPIIEDTAKGLAANGVKALAYACTSGSYVRGIGGDRDIADRISGATGLAATTTSSAAVQALRHLGVTRVAVLSPHIDQLNRLLGQFLEDSGFRVVRMKGLGKGSDIELIPPETTLDIIVKEVDRPDADGVFVSCTSMRTASIMDAIEQMINKPVVTANQATVWELLRLAGVSGPMPKLGRLYNERRPAQ